MHGELIFVVFREREGVDCMIGNNCEDEVDAKIYHCEPNPGSPQAQSTSGAYHIVMWGGACNAGNAV